MWPGPGGKSGLATVGHRDQRSRAARADAAWASLATHQWAITALVGHKPMGDETIK